MSMTQRRYVYALGLLILILGATCRKDGDKRVAAAGSGLSVTHGSGPGRTTVEIEFRGIICHVTSGNVQRAVLVADDMHTPLLTLPISYKAQLQNAFSPDLVIDGPRRDDECSLKIKGMTLEIVGTDGLPPVNRLQHRDLDPPVIPHLYSMGIVNLHEDVLNAFPANTNPVAAWFDLNGGDSIPTKFARCKGRFDNTPDQEQYYKDFNKFVGLSMTTSTRAVLRVHTSANNIVALPLGASRLEMRISNNPLDVNEMAKPHFHLFKYLEKNPPNDFPNVIPKEGCIKEIGTVAGCSNSAWP